LLVMDEITKLEKTGTGLLRDKKEMLAAIEMNQRGKWTTGRYLSSLES